jgi:GTP-binding protein YchF
MGFRCGIVGLPNVGKSTLFNALTNAQSSEVGNYPFCTVEPHIGRVSVVDPELQNVSELSKSKNVIHAQLEIVDIAGLVRGANKGEGLGNQFLGNIREVDAILHLVRCFDDEQVSHVEGLVDPIRDIDLIDTELMLADLESIEKQLNTIQKLAKSNDKDALKALPIAEQLISNLRNGQPARALELNIDDKEIANKFHLLTAKPVLYVCNVDELNALNGNTNSEKIFQRAKSEGTECIIISAAIEAEIASLENFSDRQEFIDSLGLKEAGLNRLVRAGYSLLELICYYTAGEKESRAWTIKRGTNARDAAGVIHTDFARGFICAETISYKDYIEYGGEQRAKEAGKMRQEGRDYIVEDKDVMLFRFNV